MGGSQSKNDEKAKSFMASMKHSVEDELARRMMVQREVQLAVNIAKARDNLMIFGTAWGTLTVGVVAGKLAGKPVPAMAGVPVVVGALLLGNMADMAYGNKLSRVNKEASYILDHERGRFVPFHQAPFAKFYTDEERAAMYDPASAVGELWPSSMFTRRSGK